jgi:Secretion system C-terminal sorting domain
MRKTLLLYIVLYSISFLGQPKILFDATSAETAGCADWVIDADLSNLNWNPNAYTGASNYHSNAQRIPTPSQSGITASTVESYWTGGISAWGVDCAKKGYVVETLPYNGLITYGNASNPQDLSNYKVYVVTEPNILFTAAEKTAILTFVQNGGGLFMVADHTVSDRNHDSYDSPAIWNDLMTNNSVQVDPFGMSFDLLNFSGNSTSIVGPTNPIINGVMGNVTKVQWASGTSITMNPAANPSVKAAVYKSGTTSGNNNVLFAYSTFGNGKICAIGDSSPCDDGTGNLNATFNTNCTLYDGYISDAGGTGNHQKLLMNATIWLVAPVLSTENSVFDDFNIAIVPNPIVDKILNLSYNIANDANLIIFDSVGRIISKGELSSNINSYSIPLKDFNSGVYFCKILDENKSRTLQFVIK